jgi:hypothetical protein
MAQILLVLMSMSFHRACVEFVGDYYIRGTYPSEDVQSVICENFEDQLLQGRFTFYTGFYFHEYYPEMAALTNDEYEMLSPDSQQLYRSRVQESQDTAFIVIICEEAFDTNQCRTFYEACIRLSAGDTCQVVLDRLDHYWKHHSGRIAEVVVSIMVQRGYDEEYPDTDNIPDDIFDAIWKDAQLSIILQEVYKNCPE